MTLVRFIDVLRVAMFSLFILLISGCAHHSGQRLTFELFDHPEKPAPACKYELRIDEKLVHWGLVERCPDDLPGGGE